MRMWIAFTASATNITLLIGQQHFLLLSRILEEYTEVVGRHLAIHRRQAGLRRQSPFGATIGPLQQFLGGSVDTADPKAESRSVGFDVDRRVEPTKGHQGSRTSNATNSPHFVAQSTTIATNWQSVS